MPQLDFREQNLQGKSFKKMTLSEANFSKSNICSCDFSGANLEGANFQGAIAGLSPKQEIILVATATILAFIAGLVAALAAGVFFIAFQKSLGQATLLVVLVLAPILTLGTTRFGYIALASAIAVAIAVAGAGVGALIGANMGAISVALFLIVGVVGAATGAGIYATIGTSSVWIAGIGSLVAAIALSFWMNNLLAGGIAILIAGTVEVLAGIVAHSAFTGSEKLTFVRQSALAFTTWGGTSFHKSNLTNADFSFAHIAKADFRSAVVIRTDFKGAMGADYCRFEKTVLYSSKIREICITRNGQGKIFDGLSIQGVNWSEANLSDTSFIGADLNKADLRGADLSRAKLLQVKLDQTNLNEAQLTGAYIENWGITGDTKLNDVECKYVFMRLPTPENPEPYRKPDNREEEFQPGDFADFIRPIVETLDLYHNGTVDPRGIAISFKQLAENNPDANLEIVAMERRGNNKLLIRAKTAEDANLSQLNAEYFATYNQFIALPPQAQAQLLAEKDNRIQSLEAMVTTALQRHTFYTENNIQQVDTMHSNPGNISQSVSGGAVYGGLQATQGDGSQQTMETTVAPATDEKLLTQSEVIQLLVQIEALIDQAELPADIKEESALYLGAAKKATEKEEPKKTLAADNLKSMAETLQTASKTVESSKSLLENMKPLLSQLPTWLGVTKGFFGF